MSCAYGQARQSIPDTLRAHRADIDSNAVWHDTLAVDVQVNTDSLTAHTTSINAKLPLSGGTMTGALKFGDAISTAYGSSDDLLIAFNGTDGVLTTQTGKIKLYTTDTSPIELWVDESLRWSITTAGFIPGGDGLYTIGSNAVRPSVVYSDLVTTASLTLGATAITATGTELNYSDGVTSNIQVQLDSVASYHDSLETNVQSNTSLISGLSTAQGSVIQDSIYAQIIPMGVSLSYPTSSEFVPLLRLPYDITIEEVYIGIVGGTSLNYNIHFGTSISAIEGLTSYSEVYASYEQTASKAGELETEQFSVSPMDVDAGNWLVFVTNGMSGTVEYVVVTINATRR